MTKDLGMDNMPWENECMEEQADRIEEWTAIEAFMRDDWIDSQGEGT